jgi:hypothetical protein
MRNVSTGDIARKLGLHTRTQNDWPLKKLLPNFGNSIWKIPSNTTLRCLDWEFLRSFKKCSVAVFSFQD